MASWALKTAAIWLAICGAIALAISGHGDLGRLFGAERPVVAVAVTPHAPSSVPNEIVYRRQRDGHFYVDADVNGARVRFLVDTGASVVALSPADARAAGFSASSLDFSARVTTANGVARVAPVTLREIDLQQLSVFDVPAVVLEEPMPVSLLGMSFLGRLDGYEMRDDRLILRW